MHQFAHWPRIHSKRGTLTNFSAFPFEGYFSLVKRLNHEGTASIGLQIARGTLIRLANGHSCEKALAFSTKKTGQCDDTVAYTFANGKFIFYQIEAINTKEVTGRVIKTRAYNPGPLNWGKVGVYTYVELTEKMKTFPLSDLAGHGIVVGDVISSCPMNILQED